MKYFGKFLFSLVLFLILITSCDKEKETAPKILFSVDLDEQKFDDVYNKKYIAAYTTDGEFINYGCLTDSVKWELRGICTEDKIDIIYFEIDTTFYNSPCGLNVHHFRNVSTGCSFTDPNRLDQKTYCIDLVLKVEDFGNYTEDPEYYESYEMWPHLHLNGGEFYNGSFIWDKIEDGYSYKEVRECFLPDEVGLALVIFERGTNRPYIASIENSAGNLNKGDTIELKKSDFNPGEFKPIQINNTVDEADFILITYNSKEGREDLVTSFEDSRNNSIRYVSSDILPISHWELVYQTIRSKKTSYTIRTSMDIPSSIDVRELEGTKFWKSGNQLCLIHGHTFSDKNLARSSLHFAKYKTDGVFIDYIIYFSGIESVVDIVFKPIEMPDEILFNNPSLTELYNIDWIGWDYSQVYTDIPENSPLDYLRNNLLRLEENDSSTDEYIYEVFRFNL